jgi:hypothetical protein
MSNSRPSSPSSGSVPIHGNSTSTNGPTSTFPEYQGHGSGMMPFGPTGSVLFLQPGHRSSFQMNNWPPPLNSDHSPLGSLSQRPSVDEISHFPSLSSDTDVSTHGGSFSGPAGILSSSQGGGSMSHMPFLPIPFFSEPRSGMSFMTSSTDAAGMRDMQNSNPSQQQQHQQQLQQHQQQQGGNNQHPSHDPEADHIGGEPQRTTPRTSWMYAPPGQGQYRPASSPPEGLVAQQHHHIGGGGFGNHPSHYAPFPLSYPPMDFRHGTGSISAASTRSDMTEETREDPTSETATYPRGEELDEDMEEESDDVDLYDEEDISSTNTRPRSRRSGAVAARASLAGRNQNLGAMAAGGIGSIPFPGGLPPPDRHRGTGRKKIDIKPIPYKLKRQITFSKRKTGLLKKVKELTTLTQTEALVILVSETGNPHSYATKKFHDMIRNADTKTLNSFLDTEEKRAKGGKH